MSSPVAAPAGTTHARFSLFDDFTDGNDDLDVYVFNSSGTLVGASGGPTSAEEVNLVNPAADTYSRVCDGRTRRELHALYVGARLGSRREHDR